MSFGRFYNPFYDFFDAFDDLFAAHPRQRAIEGSEKKKDGDKQVATKSNGQLRGFNNWFNASPQIDLYDKPERYEVVASVPGTTIEKLDIDFDPETRVLSISGEDTDSASGEDEQKYLKWQERWSGKFQRSVTLPREPKVLEDDIKANVNNGVLRITIPKEPVKESKSEKKKIKVTSKI
ncbi:hypothetical protein TRICI_005262 [Trichomonascus ciferrii]|uniref:SHSP domain-containing protein n=1 Tax=Trichomonascus ciferrii TaxID=44093 RepID=A0A642UZ91_9ASCO|nr:hypothetical protein TRICI_005262 [Trichomonascus ciferrii]